MLSALIMMGIAIMLDIYHQRDMDLAYVITLASLDG